MEGTRPERPPRRIGLAANLNKPNAIPVSRLVRSRLETAGRTVVLHPALAEAMGDRPPSAGYLDTDLLLCLGGDGTLLHTVRSMEDRVTPVLGVNLGGLGFLTAVSSHEVEDCLASVLEGTFLLQDRHLLRATFRRENNHEVELDALNEIMIDEGTFTRRAVVLKVNVSGAYVGTFTADGLIVATPTGSTAYSLSAGGPIVKPSLPALVVTPLCPHSLAIRPLVFGEHEPVEVENLLDGVTMKITADGQDASRVAPGSPVRIGLSPRKVRLAFLPDRSYYEILRSKLNWGGIPKDR